ncbi:MAG: transglutaminase domain-containing protein [Oscillospiraceae bacterium]|nr:transglutaminase domain-containing protein [Oscillospiraceae bacterium]
MKRMILLLAAVCLLLSGCGVWMDGHYESVTLHQEQLTDVQSGTVSAANYTELLEAMTRMVDSSTESAVIYVSDYDQSSVEVGVGTAARYLQKMYPIGAYAIEKIDYEIGTGGGKPAVSVNISYIHGRSEIRKIQKAQDMAGMEAKIADALEKCDAGVVILVENFEATDLTQFVEDYAMLNPDTVMETPQVAVGLYPDAGTTRVLELNFTYQTSRDALRQMQTQVEPYFASASLYVSGDGADSQKYAQLYAFLLERYDYKFETSLTPAYSLLCHGVGDCEAFASVYAAMCRQAGLECRIVSGTKAGEPWYWNMICDDGVYYHVDLLRCNSEGGFRMRSDAEMEGYVWDYSAYDPSVTAETEPQKNN